MKKNNCWHVFMEKLRDTRELLGQNPNADAGVACRKSKLDKFSCPTFHVLRLHGHQAR